MPGAAPAAVVAPGLCSPHPRLLTPTPEAPRRTTGLRCPAGAIGYPGNDRSITADGRLVVSTVTGRRRSLALALILLGSAGCEAMLGEKDDSVVVAAEAAQAPSRSTRLAVVGEFVGRYDSESATFTLEHVTPTTAAGTDGPAADGPQSVRQPLFCESRVTPGVPGTVSLTTLDGTTGTVAADCGLDGAALPYNVQGAFCATVRRHQPPRRRAARGDGGDHVGLAPRLRRLRASLRHGPRLGGSPRRAQSADGRPRWALSPRRHRPRDPERPPVDVPEPRRLLRVLRPDHGADARAARWRG